MLGGLLLPPYLTSYSGGGGHVSEASSTSYDNSGPERRSAAADELDKLRTAKFQALYGGDVPGSVAAGQRIRSLMGYLNSGEDLGPRVSSRSTSTSRDHRAPQLEGTHDPPAPREPSAGHQWAPTLPHDPGWEKKKLKAKGPPKADFPAVPFDELGPA